MDIEDKDEYERLVDRYLLDHASASERRAVEDRRARDETFAEDLVRDRAIVTGLRAAEDRALKDRLQRLEAAQPYRRINVRRLPIRRWIALAASVAVLLLAGWWLLEGAADPETLLAEYFEPYPNRAFNLTKGETPATTRARAYAAYEAADYTGAATAFAELIDPDPADRFYFANALLALSRADEALPLFRALSGLEDFALAPHSQWYEALSLLALDRPGQARPVLQTIDTDADHPFQSQATALLRRLE